MVAGIKDSVRGQTRDSVVTGKTRHSVVTGQTRESTVWSLSRLETSILRMLSFRNTLIRVFILHSSLAALLLLFNTRTSHARKWSPPLMQISFRTVKAR